jgi:soluble lytic murein transglycosylase-like protein
LSAALAAAGCSGLLALASDGPLAARAPEIMASCAPEAELVAEPRDPAQDILVRYLSRRYSIAAEATERMVGAAFHASREVGLDPLLVLAVISVESRFNPIAESVMGAKGLMQIIPKYHRARLVEYGGDAAVFDPEANIRVGTEILRDYVQRTGTLEAGLQFYNGALRDSSTQYAQRVMAERARLMLALGGS